MRIEKRIADGMNGYIKANKMSIMLTGAMMAVTAVIYGLYRLPWGPAVYVILMEAVILAGVLEHFMGIYGVYLACGIAVSSSVPVGWWFYRSNRWKIAKNVA